MTSIRILADDLTGALDTAAAFAGEVPVFIDRPPTTRSMYSDARISVVATPTRDAPPEDIPKHLQPALGWLKSGDLAFKKVDSLLRGNTFSELAWLAQTGEFDTTVFAPAFPAQGRVTLDGRQWVIEPGKLAGPRKPVALPFVEAFSGYGRIIGLDAEPDGKALDVWAPDVVSDAELEAVVTKAESDETRSRLWCGSAGLAHALARRFGLAPGPTNAVVPAVAADTGPTVLVSASHHPVFRQQWELLCSASKPRALVRHASVPEMRNALDLVNQGATSAWFDLSPMERLDPAQAAQALYAQMAQLTGDLPRPKQLIVIGGDTLLGLCRAAGVDALLARASVRNGWGCARFLGGTWDGVPCYSRSGAFGGMDDLSAMIHLLDGNATH
jgi:uncharacterized protein YgbK (DUF1537 family)